jgi:Zn-dependent peptidase ImmA (M78 family)/transcriptional regulator with XRE-family HTH domain
MVSLQASRLTAARRLRGMTLTEVATLLGVTPSLVGKWENEKADGSHFVAELAEVLSVPKGFLQGTELTVTSVESVSFRRRQDAKRATRDRAASCIDIAYGELLPLMREEIMLHPTSIPNYSGEAPEVAARQLREAWGLGSAPIKSVSKVLEAKGVRLFMTSDPSPSMSAFTKWIEGEPIMFLNTSISDGCRHRFNAAHELGHLVLHRDLNFESSDARLVEREADTFASHFLLTEQFLDEAPRAFIPAEFFNAKTRWGTSAQAMVRRLRDAGRLTEWQYNSAMIWFSSEGYRSNPEPNSGTMEESVLHRRFVESLANKDVAPEQYATHKYLPIDLLFEMIPAMKHQASLLRIKGIFEREWEERFGPGWSRPTVYFED